MRVVLALALIAIITFPKQAFSSNCFQPSDLKRTLHLTRYIQVIYAYVDNGFLLSFWQGPYDFLITAEDETTACIIAGGVNLYINREIAL